MRSRRLLYLCICMLLLLSLTVFAHPGDLDDNGGHIDHSTGEYHYHHGYPEHNHYDMDGDGDIDCPYNFHDQAGINSGSNSTTNSKNDNMVNEEVKIVPPWVYWSFAGLALIIVCLIVSILVHRSDIRYMKDRHQREVDFIKLECQKEIDERLAAVAQLDTINAQIKESKKELYKAQFLVADEYKRLDNVKLIACRMKDAPLDITFADNGLPIYWKPNMRKPYGDYTVFVNRSKNIYHVDPVCASYMAYEDHIFNVIDHTRPCKKCAQGFFDFEEAPHWFTASNTKDHN